MIDYAALNEWPTAVQTIGRLKPHAYVKGSDYANRADDVTGKINEEEQAVRDVGGQLVFTDGFRSSSSHLINRLFSVYPPETQAYLQEFRRRHTADHIISRLKSLSDLKVLVVGEAIVDQYTYCTAVGKSPKESIVSTKFSSEERFAGGAVATANHVAGFCGDATLITALGAEEEDAAFIKRTLRPNARMEHMRLHDRPTVRKQRFIDPNYLTKMFEIQYMDDRPLKPEAEVLLGRKLEEEVPKHDLVVVNDFGHGLLTDKLRRYLSGCGKYLALNAQSNSANHGYNTVTNYTRADYCAIDELELRLAAKSKFGDVRALSETIREQLRLDSLLVSRGANGTVLLSGQQFVQTPALATRIVDRVGAGDALFALTSPCAYRGMTPEMIGFIGNCVGGLAVEIVGNREPINPIALFRFIETLLK